MQSPWPRLLSSDRSFFWTLSPQISLDYFSFQAEGACALLLLGMHVQEKLPWISARNPLMHRDDLGVIDLESKRILGKRYLAELSSKDSKLIHSAEIFSKDYIEIDPIALVLKVIHAQGHSFFEAARVPETVKEPGKLLPRKLTATAKITYGHHQITLYSRNFSEISQSLHAELSVLFALSEFLSQESTGSAMIDEFTLETTLKPCRMCAAFLHVLRKKCRSFRVSYTEDDTGRLAQNTFLDRFGYD